MAPYHHPDGELTAKKVKLKFAVAETMVVDMLMDKESQKQTSEESKNCAGPGEDLRNSLKEKTGRGGLDGSNDTKPSVTVSTRKSSRNAKDAKKTEKKVMNERGLGHKSNTVEKGVEVTVKLKKKGVMGHNFGRAAQNDKVGGKAVELKQEPFLPTFRNLSNYSVRVPKQKEKQASGVQEEVSHLPPLPDEASLFVPPSRTMTAIQDIAQQLLICLEPIDTGVTLDLHNLADELGVDVKKIFLIGNVLEAVGMFSRISMSKVVWNGKDAMYQSLVQLHQLAAKENIQQQIQDVEAQGDLLHGALAEGGAGEEVKVKLTTGVITQRLLMAFLALPYLSTMSASIMGKVISSTRNVSFPFGRLYDMANVLVGIGLLKKVKLEPRKTPAYQYVGPLVEAVEAD